MKDNVKYHYKQQRGNYNNEGIFFKPPPPPIHRLHHLSPNTLLKESFSTFQFLVSGACLVGAWCRLN